MFKKFYKKNNRANGFTPTPQLGVMSRAFFKIRQIYEIFAFSKHPTNILRRHTRTTPSLVRGFTLIETLVAITVLLVAVVGPLTLATRSLNSALVARDQLTASYLAQDAVEYIRHKRDNNFLRGRPWLDGTVSECVAPKICRVESDRGRISDCAGDPGGVCKNLTYDEVESIYGYKNVNSNDVRSTTFNRTVTLSPSVDNPNNEYTIDVTVSWNTGSFAHSFTTREYIYNWHGN